MTSYREPDWRLRAERAKARVAELEAKAKRRQILPRLRRAPPNVAFALGCTAVVSIGVAWIADAEAEHDAEMAEYERRRTVLCEHACPGEVVDKSGGWDQLRCLCAAPDGGLLTVEPWGDDQ